ncbi:hypothetical protein [Aureicoccus marinus]|uniref:Lipoprotein n=1 Tax=Aureicoccus marinus TaxID=754435 RepID=A0A2S7TAP0_9FLAO|nr:hypothetical protein [Aureicoccus marinus]PQJ16577.1 hypothetical protein BST99_13365 [Aureicoccus marinus]
MKRTYIKNISLFLFFLAFFSCGSERKNNVIHLYSKDKSQVVSIISNYNKKERIIAVGKHISKPVKDYIELDISKTTKLDDQFGICWNTNGHKWEMVNDKAKIVKVALDTTIYVFRESWFKDKGTPNTKYYIKTDCFVVGALNYSEHYPEENGSVERFN